MNSYSELDERIINFDKFIELPAEFGQPRTLRLGARFLLVCADLLSIVLTFWLVIGLYRLFIPDRNIADGGYFMLGPLLLVFGGTFTLTGLYRARGVSQIEEIRQLTIATTVIFLTIFSFHILMVPSDLPVTLFPLSWFLAIAIIPMTRIAARYLGSITGVWGEPVVIFGSGELSRKVMRYLVNNPYYGLRPVMVVEGLQNPEKDTRPDDPDIPTMPLSLWLSTLAAGVKTRIRTAIVVTPELPDTIQASITRGEHLGFAQIITISQQFNTRNDGLMPLDFGGILGLQERHYELSKIEEWQVRVFDLLLIFLSLPALLPIFLLIIAAIKLDSKGSIFYRQTRIGKGGEKFPVLKFRTMVQDADIVLKEYLESNPSLKAEWQADHKLKNDPRITRIGRLLRKTSLDELPQIWNVVEGKMSLVGPRPIVAAEIEKYGERFEYYKLVPPGITGLWQVSGRNDVNYDKRVRLDEYYVRNRSIWFNLYILVRTSSVVIRRKGAY